MNRITIDDLTKAKEILGTDFTLVKEGWGDGANCGCALTAMLCARQENKHFDIHYVAHLSEDNFEDMVAQLAIAFDGEYDKDYLHGFVSGFDYDYYTEKERTDNDLRATAIATMRLYKGKEQAHFTQGFIDGYRAKIYHQPIAEGDYEKREDDNE